MSNIMYKMTTEPYPWAPAGGGARKGGTCASPWNLKKMTSYAAVLQNTLKFSLAPLVLAIDTLYFSPFFLQCRFFEVSVILPPSEKISAGAHEWAWMICGMLTWQKWETLPRTMEAFDSGLWSLMCSYAACR